MQPSFVNRLVKLGFVTVLVAGVIVAGLANDGGTALAHEDEAQTFVIQAGAYSGANSELLAFAPGNLQVHRGDTVVWSVNGFHNVHFHEDMISLAIFPEVDGQPLPQIDPAVAFPNIENGGVFTGQPANSGIPMGPEASPFFSLVIDAEPGVYTFQCDIHPGMMGTIEVVADDVEIPSPSEATMMASEEIGGHFGMAMAATEEQMMHGPLMSEDGNVNVQVGSSGTGRVTVNLFSSPNVTISAGETVTWTNPEGSIEPHFVNSLPYDEEALQEIIPMPQEGGAPILMLGPGFLGTTQSGATIAAGESFNSGFILPGDSFMLTFSDPGVYDYWCHIHPGMRGSVVVQ